MPRFRRIAVAFAALLTAGCYDSRFGEPDGNAPGEPATETIAALRARYAGTPFTVTGDIVVAGTVTTSDRAENFYRTLCIEADEAAVEVMAGIDHLHNDFPTGCHVTLRLKGLTVAESRGVLQIGRPPAVGSGYATDYIGSQPALAAVLARNGENLHSPTPALRRISELTPALCGHAGSASTASATRPRTSRRQRGPDTNASPTATTTPSTPMSAPMPGLPTPMSPSERYR